MSSREKHGKKYAETSALGLRFLKFFLIFKLCTFSFRKLATARKLLCSELSRTATENVRIFLQHGVKLKPQRSDILRLK